MRVDQRLFDIRLARSGDDNLPAGLDDLVGSRQHEIDTLLMHETCDKFMGSVPNAYSDFLAERGLLDAYAQHIADRSYKGEKGDGQDATKTIPMWDSTPSPLPLDAYIDTWHGDMAVEWLEQYDRDEPFHGFWIRAHVLR